MANVEDSKSSSKKRTTGSIDVWKLRSDRVLCENHVMSLKLGLEQNVKAFGRIVSPLSHRNSKEVHPPDDENRLAAGARCGGFPSRPFTVDTRPARDDSLPYPYTIPSSRRPYIHDNDGFLLGRRPSGFQTTPPFVEHGVNHTRRYELYR